MHARVFITKRCKATEAYKLVQENLGEKSHPGCGLAALMQRFTAKSMNWVLPSIIMQDTLEPQRTGATDLLIAAFEARCRLMMHAGAVEEGLGFLKDGIKWAGPVAGTTEIAIG